MHFQELHTARTLLRRIDQEVLDYVYSEFNLEQLTIFLGLNSPEAVEIERNKHAQGLSTFNKHFLYFNILEKNSEKALGWCGYHTWYIEHRRAEIGYGLFDDKYKGKGIMTEVLRRVIDYGFDKMNLHRIEAFIGPDNLASLRLIRNANFVEEGILRQHYIKNGQAEDSIVFGLINDQWQV